MTALHATACGCKIRAALHNSGELADSFSGLRALYIKKMAISSLLIAIAALWAAMALPVYAQENDYDIVITGSGRPFDDPRIQQAILSSIDWWKIRQRVVLEFPAIGRQIEVGEASTDRKTARKLMWEAGYPGGLDIRILFVPNTGIEEAVQIIKPNLDSIGQRIFLERMSSPDTLSARMREVIAKGGAVLGIQLQRRR